MALQGRIDPQPAIAVEVMVRDSISSRLAGINGTWARAPRRTLHLEAFPVPFSNRLLVIAMNR
jgi:hypothetical protein